MNIYELKKNLNISIIIGIITNLGLLTNLGHLIFDISTPFLLLSFIGISLGIINIILGEKNIYKNIIGIIINLIPIICYTLILKVI